MNPLDKVGGLVPTRRALSLVEEFKAFALKGNVIDLAVGVIIGAAFGKIVDSLVKHVLMPLIAAVTPGGQGYKGWKFTVNGSDVLVGVFLGEVVNFLIVALALFLFIKAMLIDSWSRSLRFQVVFRNRLEALPMTTRPRPVRSPATEAPDDAADAFTYLRYSSLAQADGATVRRQSDNFDA